MTSEQEPGWRPSEDDTPTQVFELIPPGEVPAPPGPSRVRERRAVRLTAALGAVVLAVIGVATYEVVSHAGHTALAVVARTSVIARRSAIAHQSAPATPSAALASPTAAPSASVSASPARPAPPRSRTLWPASVIAYGPGGLTGDDPAGAVNVLSGRSPIGWQSDWYATPYFGGLQKGTGLLFDMGHQVTLTSVQVWLGGISGAYFQLRVGDAASSTRVAGVSDGAGGTITLTLPRPVRARYVLLWFTKLPPDGMGRYRVKVLHVVVRGY